MAKNKEKDEGFPSGIFFWRLGGIVFLASTFIAISWFMISVLTMLRGCNGP